MNEGFPGHLEVVALDAALEAQVGPHLSLDERARRDRFVHADDRRRFAGTRGLLRVRLAERLGVRPAAIVFEEGPNGKPRLAARGSRLEFNVSHSGQVAILAVTEGRAVGVDVEHLRARAASDAIAAALFSDLEQRALACASSAAWLRTFYRIWTRKEAFIKATGEGLSADLRAFDVAAGEVPALLATRPDPAEASRWRMGSVAVPDSYEGAFVVAR